jgi:hypothetical protein
MAGDVTVGLNRQLNNENITLAAATRAKSAMKNLFAIELGNEPECQYTRTPFFTLFVLKVIRQSTRQPHLSSPLARPGALQQMQLAKTSGLSLRLLNSTAVLKLQIGHRFTDFGSTLGAVFQGGVYLNEPTWGTAELIPKLTTATQYIKVSFLGEKVICTSPFGV